MCLRVELGAYRARERAAGRLTLLPCARCVLDRVSEHGKGRRTIKDRCRRHELDVVELEVNVCAEYSCGRIRPRRCVAEELEELEGIKAVQFIA
jgi:hypothetical protein